MNYSEHQQRVRELQQHGWEKRWMTFDLKTLLPFSREIHIPKRGEMKEKGKWCTWNF